MTTRVYMGGLGGGVTEADVEKTFAPLGRVRRVEFVRTRGRAFAFMDFEPNSDKSLAKLFATYNGCIWKGGRLRLEKAKEHYLNRLRREWAEDAEHTNKPVAVDMTEGSISSGKIKSMATANMQLRIFFPKLRKVKAVPFKGTGKHKYSFQRVVPPPLPVHFCDCEEHYQSPEDNNKDALNCQKDPTVVVNEEELIIMNSVMNRLLEKEANADIADSKAFSSTKRDILDHSKDEAQFGDTEAAELTEVDADDLVTNIGLGDGGDVPSLMQLRGWGTASADQKLTLGKRQSFHDRLILEKQNIQKGRTAGPRTVSEEPSSKRARLQSEESKKTKHSNVVTGKVGCQGTGCEERNDSSGIQPRGTNCPTEGPDIKSESSQNLAFGQSTTGASWVQKSSWKELIGDGGSSTFTISHVVPCVDSLTARSSKFDGASGSIQSTDGRSAEPQSGSSYLKPPAEVGESSIPAKEKIAAPPGRGGKSSEEDGTYAVGVDTQERAPRSRSSQEPRAATAKLGVGQVCTFMRSADSVKEWAKTKAALSGHLKKMMKKKGHGSTTSQGTQVAPPR